MDIIFMKLFLTLLIFQVSGLRRKSYKGYKDYQVVPESKDQFNALKVLESKTGIEVDFGSGRIGNAGQAIRVLVSPQKEALFEQFLKRHGMTAKLVNNDIEKLIKKEKSAVKARSKFKSYLDPSKITLNEYHSVKEIYKWLKSLATYYPSLVKVRSLGKSVEKRDLLMITIGKEGGNKKGFWIDAGIHAREWIAPASAVYIIHELVTNAQYANFLERINFYILPLMNPDGYQYTKKDRMWRKNRSATKCPKNGGKCCMGVDLNRNFPFHFGEQGTSEDPCKENYIGTKALSEPEASSVANFLHYSNSNIETMITIHSYGQNILYPYSYGHSAKADNWQYLYDLGKRMEKAMEALNGANYTAKHSAGWYEAAGVSDDWAKSIGIKHVYCMELRPVVEDEEGFFLKPQYIIPASKEALAGILVVADEMIK